MPLDSFQKKILQAIHPLRSRDSVFAGGSVLHRHGHRVSDDQDIFHGEGVDVVATAQRDIEALRGAGFEVEMFRPHEGFVEAIVSGIDGHSRIQWVESGSWNFFGPIPDPDYGWRLHMADLCTNKILAAGGRRRVRDFVDLVLIHRHLIPLWHCIWAAPGKDESWTPNKLLERISANNHFRQQDLDQDVLSTMYLSAGDIGETVRDALDEARGVFQKLKPSTAGHLFVDEAGSVVSDLPLVLSGVGVRSIEPARGGTWPSGPELDRALIERLVEEFGWEGAKLTRSDPFSP